MTLTFQKSKKITTRLSLKPVYFYFFLMFISLDAGAQFSVGNVVVLQIGDGVNTLTNTGNALTFNEYNSSGTLTYSVAIPTMGSNAMLLRGNATSEGYISRSADGNYLIFGAYMRALPNASVLNSSASSAINRGVGVINAAGIFTVGAGSASFFSAGDIRGAAATTSTELWASGSNQGLNYFGTAATATNVEGTKTNLRAAHIFSNQIYISSQVASGTPSDVGVYTVGSGTPNTSSQTVSTFINTGTGSMPGQFFFNQAGNVCYIADARNTSSGGIQKWVFSSSAWSLAYTLPTGTAAIGAFGVVVDFSGFNPKIYATTNDATQNRLVAIVDVGAASTATTLVTAVTGMLFRGLALAPGTSTCVPPNITSVTNNGPVCSSQGLAFNVNTTGSSPITYSWSGQGAFSSTSVVNPTVTNAVMGSYTVLLSNVCGSASTAVNVSVNPTPTLQANSAIICLGGIATITASGASTYTWSNNTNSTTFTASPAATTVYSVTGTSSANCPANTATVSVTVISSPTIAVNSPTICAGSSTALIASGADTYTWSTSQNTGSILVSPNTTTVYTVSGSVSGCSVIANNTSTVYVNSLPSLTLALSNPSYCVGGSASVIGSPSGGTYSGLAVSSGGVFSPTKVGQYTISYSYTNATTSCSNSISNTLTVNECVGIREVKANNNKISIYPNPANAYITFKFDILPQNSVVIYDALGARVMQFTAIQKTSQINIGGLKPGMYFIEVNDVRCRFVKE